MTRTEHSDDPTPVFDPLAGARQRIGRVLREKWRLDALLGVGGMAAVYAATHRNGSRVAIKILHPELSASVEVRTRFLREGYAANSVGHDGVVRVSDDDIAEDAAAFLVMELLDGETFEERRERHGGRLSEDEVLSVADQVLDVLVAAHAKGIVHRDLKPENVFLTRVGQVKVLDFGIARLREASIASTATQSGASMGTPSYMPPEQARGRWSEVDARSDIWAVGAVMYRLLTGQLVHDGPIANEVLLDAMTQRAAPLASILPGVSPAVARLVDKALAFEREHRWQDAANMQDAVRSAYHDRHGAPISTAPRLTVPPNVVNRTLASATAPPVSPGAATTNGAVAATRLGAALVSLAVGVPRLNPLAIGVGGAVFAAAIGVGMLVSGGRKVPASSTAEVAPMAPARPARSLAKGVSSSEGSPPGPVFAAKPKGVPVIAPTDLPIDTAEALASKKPPAKALVPSPAPTTSTAAIVKPAKPDCLPPYVLDLATGTKKWKPQCFE